MIRQHDVRGREFRFLLVGLLVFLCAVLTHQPAFSQLAYELNVSGQALAKTKAKDQSRASHQWVVYTPGYGFSTRTNGHGVDIPVLQTSVPNQYKVSRTSNHMACFQPVAQRQSKVAVSCGDVTIPHNGLVLSAHGRAMAFLKQLQPGMTFSLTPQWFQAEAHRIDVVNPSTENNGRYCGFPGCRGSGQLLMYTPEYGEQRTGTNEFGFEVTVLEGMVVAQEGSDSYIPKGGVVLSGHGSSRNWLIEHAPLGARIHYDPKTHQLTSSVDVWTYRYQLAQRYDQAVQSGQCVDGLGQVLSACRKVQRVLETLATEAQADRPEMANRLENSDKNPIMPPVGDAPVDSRVNVHAPVVNTLTSDVERAKLATETLQWFQEQLWQHYPTFKPIKTSYSKNEKVEETYQKPIQGVWHRPVETTRDDVRKTLAFFRASGINTVFLETYYHGYTLFPSKTMEEYGLPKQHPSFKALGDPLQVWVEEAHQLGLQIHPWMETFYAGNRVAPPQTDSKMGPIISRYPDWANITFGYRYSGHIVPSPFETGSYFLDPAQPEVQEFLLTMMTEMVNRYDIDGLQLDYIRYPSAMPENKAGHLGSSWGYTTHARRTFYQKTGVDPADFTYAGIRSSQKKAWKQWRTFKNDVVSHFVKTVSVMTHSYNATHPNSKVMLSAAVFPKPAESLGRKHQEWPVWVEREWLDAIVPITLTSAVKVVDEDTRLVRKLSPPNVQVVSGVFGAFNQNTPDHLLAQIEAARFRGADGFSVFDSAHLTGAMSKAMGFAYRD